MIRSLWLVPGVLSLAASPAGAEDDEARERIARDLLTVITMQGLPCGAVVEARRQTDEDYTVECQTGDRYRVRIIDERVRVERL